MRAEVTNQWAEEGHGGGGGSWTEPGSWGQAALYTTGDRPPFQKPWIKKETTLYKIIFKNLYKIIMYKTQRA